MKLALDAMGSDDAPRAELEGLRAFREHRPEVGLLLVGQPELLSGDLPPGVDVVPAPSVVTMQESPGVALRAKPDSSIGRAVELCQKGKARAVVSAGNTGAVMAFALNRLGAIEGVSRPALGAFFPAPHGSTFVLDIGANIAPRPEQLVQFAVMGSVVVNLLDGKARPRVGLLNVGQEAQKGTDLVREAHERLAHADVNFTGNIEGHDVMRGAVDVVVCDGFVGNVMLKFGEGLAAIIGGMLRDYMASESHYRLRRWLSKPVMQEFLQRMDYQEHGGALLLGVAGTVVIGHGRSSPHAIRNALALAARCAELDIAGHVRNRFARLA